MDVGRRRELVERYREGPLIVDQALERLTAEELDHRPSGGGWSPRQVVHHLADSEMTSAIRLRRLLAEDDPQIQGYDEEEFARRLHYDSRPLRPSLDAFRASRATTADILDLLDDEDWARAGNHSEVGPYSVEAWLEIYAAHGHDHAGQIAESVADARGKGE
jgi:hypothetical protein